jgi:hypothetical protein
VHFLKNQKLEPLGSGVQDDCNHVGALSQKEKGVTTTHYITLVYVRVKGLKKLTVMCVAAAERQKSLQEHPSDYALLLLLLLHTNNKSKSTTDF